MAEKRFQPKTLELIGQVQEIIEEYSMPLTLRQIYYQLVARQVIENLQREYKRLASILSNARKAGLISFDDITDRTRIPFKHSSWDNLKDFMNDVKRGYRKSKWTNQNRWVEVWVEKQALQGLFEPITSKYDTWLVVCRGYPSLSVLNEANDRFPDKPIHILYFGDFDPTGKDIPRSIKENFRECFKVEPEIEIIALTEEDIKEYKLPPAPAKESDPRTWGFVEEYGNQVVELDALPPDVLQEKIRTSIENYMDLGRFEKDKRKEKKDIKGLEKMIDSIKLK